MSEQLEPMKCPCVNWARSANEGFGITEHHSKCDGTGQWKDVFTPADDPAPDMVEKAREFYEAYSQRHYLDLDFVRYNTLTKRMLADFAAQVTADKDKQIAELKKRDAELSYIEFMLSRRTALDGCETTKDKILLMLKLCTELDPNGKKAFAALEDK